MRPGAGVVNHQIWGGCRRSLQSLRQRGTGYAQPATAAESGDCGTEQPYSRGGRDRSNITGAHSPGLVGVKGLIDHVLATVPKAKDPHRIGIGRELRAGPVIQGLEIREGSGIGQAKRRPTLLAVKRVTTGVVGRRVAQRAVATCSPI